MAVGERAPAVAIWQDVEFGAYTGDLPLWAALAAAASGPVLEIGAGSGRVALRLARSGHDVIAVESDEVLARELMRRWREGRRPEWGSAFAVTSGDIGAPEGSPSGEPGSISPRLAIAPLHVIQQLPPLRRASALRNLGRMLPPGGRAALVVVDEASFLYEDDPALEPRTPDMREVDGWVYASEPLWLQVDEKTIRVRRLRKRVSPDGEIERSVHDELLHRLTPDELEDEARAADLRPVARRAIASEGGEADSLAVILEVPA